MVEIKEITDDSDLKTSLQVIRDSFITVAQELNLTKENCPAHSAFTTREKLLELQKKTDLFGLFKDGMQVGFVAIEKAEGGVYYLDKLSVLPEHRHMGYGKKLVKFVIDRVKKHGGEKVSLGIIDSHAVLKEWYRSLGFRETGTKKFEHLPFVVCFMENNALS
jgi:GNAT superfamily N-acetyltransferase